MTDNRRQRLLIADLGFQISDLIGIEVSECIVKGRLSLFFNLINSINLINPINLLYLAHGSNAVDYIRLILKK